LYSALDLQLFAHVASGQDTEAKLTQVLDVSPLNVDRLVTTCLAMGLLAWDGERLVNAADVQRFLVKGEPSYAGAWMTFTRPDVERWFRMTDYLRRKEPPTVLGSYADLSVEEARAYHEATYSIGMGSGRRFARLVDLSGRGLLLDLGGGSGAYSICAVQAYPSLRAVVFDLPPVVAVTKEYLERHGVEDRVSTVGGDFTVDSFPEHVDVVVLASSLPLYDEQVTQAVVEKAHAALIPGGQMHVIGEMLRADRTGPLDAALWGLGEVLNGGEGKAHTVGQCRAYLEKAGFVDVTDHDFIPGTLHRVSGSKGR
jgi:hypothetical protein